MELQFVISWMAGKLNVFQLRRHHKFTIGDSVLVNGYQIIFKGKFKTRSDHLSKC